MSNTVGKIKQYQKMVEEVEVLEHLSDDDLEDEVLLSEKALNPSHDLDDVDDLDDEAAKFIREKLSPKKQEDATARFRKMGGEGTALTSKDQVITEYAPLIKYIAQKIASRLPANIELDDLISSGVIGLMDAVDKYDPTRDNKFKTYAEFRIRGAILDELRAQDWVPRSVREKAKMLERAYSKLEHELGRPAADDEVCEYLKISQEEYHDLLNQVRSISLLSYDDLNNLSKGDRRALMGLSDGGRTTTPFSEVNSTHVKKVVADAIRDLPEKQRLVLSLYYYEDLNLKEIGKVLDVTESRVSQLHTQAILRLRGKLKNHFDEFVMMFS